MEHGSQGMHLMPGVGLDLWEFELCMVWVHTFDFQKLFEKDMSIKFNLQKLFDQNFQFI
jgi:hypothetical protein